MFSINLPYERAATVLSVALTRYGDPLFPAPGGDWPDDDILRLVSIYSRLDDMSEREFMETDPLVAVQRALIERLTYLVFKLSRHPRFISS